MGCYDASEPVIVWVSDPFVRECSKIERGDFLRLPDEGTEEFVTWDLLEARAEIAVWEPSTDSPESASLTPWFGQIGHG